MTNEHLRPLLDSERDMHLFFRVVELLGRGDVPENVASVLRKGWLTAFAKTWRESEGHCGRGCDSSVGRPNCCPA